MISESQVKWGQSWHQGKTYCLQTIKSALWYQAQFTEAPDFIQSQSKHKIQPWMEFIFSWFAEPYTFLQQAGNMKKRLKLNNK